MNDLRSFYNRNKKTIWGVIIIIAFIILMIQVLNYIEGQKGDQIIAEKTDTSPSIDTANNGVLSTKSAVSGGQVSSSSLQTASDLINQFVEYCNEQKVEEAYNLISDDCKNQMYEDIQSFYDNYYADMFKNNKLIVTMENWTGNTYFVQFNPDLMSTGGRDTENKFSDYYTVVKKDKEYKLNINSYIGKTEINKNTEKNGISVDIQSKDTYMEYEIYNIKIKNNLNKDIVLDTKEDTKTTYLKDSKGAKYIAYLNEVPDNDLYIKSKYEKQLSIKFSNTFSSNRKISNINFTDIIVQNGDNEKIEMFVNM